MSEMSRNKADTGMHKSSAAAKIALAAIGISVVAGTAIIVGVDRVIKKIFVNEELPDEEWSSDDWADEELD